MIARPDLPRIAAVGAAAPAAPVRSLADPRQQDLERALAGQLGKTMRGDVLSRLADGSFVVRVADSAARMLLPPGTAVGNPLSLTLVALQPRPTFELGGRQVVAQALPAGAAAYASMVGDTGGGDAGAAAQLSAGGRALASVFAAAARSGEARAALVASLPLLEQMPADPAQLAQALRDAVGKSGLFYESHVRQWSEGSRSLSELKAEPQMQAGGQRDPLRDPAAAAFVNLQLITQEQGRIAWSGQLLPGIPVEWELARDGDGADDDAAPGQPAPSWRSALRLRFPGLGDIDATILIAGETLRIALRTAAPETEAALRARAGELAAALGAAGHQLGALDIHAGRRGDD